MVQTPSDMIPLGTKAPDFSLVDTISGELINLSDVRGAKGTLVMFICNHCPFVVHIQDALAKLSNDYANSGIGIVAINSNDIENYPDDAPDKMKAKALELGYQFPYLFDETQAVAKAYSAQCTPDLYLFDGDLRCAYRGQFDDARPNNDVPVTGDSLRSAMDLLLEGRAVPRENQKPSIGCNIKWK